MKKEPEKQKKKPLGRIVKTEKGWTFKVFEDKKRAPTTPLWYSTL